MRWILLFVLFSSSFLWSGSLQERLLSAEKGDYTVFQANKITTLFVIRDLTPTTLLIEEISLPSTSPSFPSSWPAWIGAKAPGHTSWSMIEIDLKTKEILECYSFSRSSWIALEPKESILITLFDLPLEKVSSEKRRKIGPAPLDQEPDFRKEWTPPFVFNGKPVSSARFDVYEARWPSDASELSGKQIELYFEKETNFPLPIWIQTQTSHLLATVRTIDSGKNLPAIFRSIPHRPPQFLSPPRLSEKGAHLFLHIPKYHPEWEFYLVEKKEKETLFGPLPYQTLSEDKEKKFFFVSKEELDRILEKGHLYSWRLVPLQAPHLYAETLQPFIW